MAHHPQPRRDSVAGFQAGAKRLDHQVGAVEREFAVTFAENLDFETCGDHFDFHGVVEGEGEAERIEAGSEIGGRGGDGDGHFGADGEFGGHGGVLIVVSSEWLPVLFADHADD